jgi:hypothetical protein
MLTAMRTVTASYSLRRLHDNSLVCDWLIYADDRRTVLAFGMASTSGYPQPRDGAKLSVRGTCRDKGWTLAD